MDSFVVVPDAASVVNVLSAAICTTYHDIPAPRSLAPLRQSVIVPLTATPLIGAVSIGGVGAVVSKIICFATLYGLSVPAVNNADIFLVPSPVVRLIACIVYGYGIISGTPIIFGLMFPFTATVLAILANNAACICVVLVYIFQP